MTIKKNSKSNHINAFVEGRKNLSNEEQVFEAGQLIAEIKEVDVDAAYSTIQQRISKKGRLLKLYAVVSRYAAILVLPLLFVSIWALLNNKQVEPNEELVMHEITCPVGMRSQVTLPDGSQVWLNAESTIKYSLPFVRENRSVELMGEAFLDVAKNANSPFSIQSGNVKVNVVGTQFNFKSYDNDNRVEVTLKEGKINLGLMSGDTEISTTEMLHGDHFVFDKNTYKATVKNQDIDNFLAWKDNKLVLDETPILEMKKIMERWYGVEIEIADKSIENYKFTTTFENETLEQVLELLELCSPIKMEYIPARIDKTTKQIINSKIIISKKN
jgi:ferric-dicitrate binding protein FerR (iron transport regulator)